MVRKGKYTKKTKSLDNARWTIRRQWRRFKSLSKTKKALIISGPILAFLIITPLLTYAFYYNDIADQARLMNHNNTGIVLKDKNGKTFYSSGRAEQRTPIGLDQISDVTEQALISAEDKDFYNHSGFSFLSIARSLYLNVLARDATGYGGSTLTQQLAKNTLLTTEQTVLRKYQELTIAMAIEQRYSKDEILAMYLDSVYYGNDSFGIEEAAQNYFGKSANDLTLAQASMLVGVLPAPSAYSPVGGSVKLAKERQGIVLTRMVNNGYITESEKNDALAEKLAFKAPKSVNNAAPHFTEMVVSQLYTKYGEEKVRRSGYNVTTTLDLDLQQAANKNIDANMAHIRANDGSNASLVAIDPKTGGVRALVGSADYDNETFGKVNMATSKRQPASTFKPLYFARGLADGTITPITVLRDERSNFNGYKPENATKQYYGDVTVRKALNWSLNIPAVKVMQRTGITPAVEQAEKLGISSLEDANKYGLSLAIGSAEVPLVEMTGAYATFANKGEHSSTNLVASIEDKFGKKVTTDTVTSTRALSEDGAYLISDILSDNNARAGMFGSSLNVTGADYRTKEVAVKTGTTDESRDAWTIGYTPDIAIGVWVGNNDNTKMRSGGADMAGPIWKNTIAQAIGSASPSFARPAGVVEKTICNNNGRYTDVFLASAVPSGSCAAVQPEREPEKQPEKEPEAPEPVEPVTPEPVEPDEPEAPVTPPVTPGPVTPNPPVTPPTNP